ncbi:MAG: polyprenyl synthetase family protein [Opitutaceae bacterium]|jgi:geranylgeranyl pyrophosphate synthase|nr:polyprenyl synthetase family protein [Opitutaceae bacterium]
MVALNTVSDPLVLALREFAPLAPHMETHLDAAITQAVSEPGKLVRARLALEAGLANGLDDGEAMQLACAIEYFHTASLLLDDMPCMDDAATRRGLPCVHRRHGDATAILAALALINRAYTLAGFAFAAQSPGVRVQAIACLDACLGPSGLVGGQAADLRYGETRGGARAVAKIAAAKTGALFWSAVFLPALASQPTEAERRELKRLCVYWGLAFQALDDLADVLKSHAEAGKSTGRDSALSRPNLALVLGVHGARAGVDRLAALAGAAADRLATHGARWSYLRRFHVEYFAPMHRRTLAATEMLVAA